MHPRTHWLLLVLALWSGCSQPPPPQAKRDYGAEADALLHGLGPGKTCRNDRDCQEGEVRAVCTLGTCFGLLTTDERVTRALLIERTAAADDAVLDLMGAPLRAALASDTTTNGQKLAAVEGLGVLLARRPNDETRTLLRSITAEKDEALATTARLALGRVGDETVRAALLEDLTRGTELLRAEAARALAPAVQEAGVQSALVGALQDGSPVVQLAALRALTVVAQRQNVAAPLRELAARTPAFRYEVEQLLAGGAK